MISFIVPAHNEAAFIGPTLEALLASARSRPEPFEVLVVDDASTDATAGIARGLGATVLSVRHRNIAAVRNAGAQASQGDVLMFVDADTRLNPEVYAEALRALADGAVSGGAEFEYDDNPPFYVRLLLPLMMRRLRRRQVITAAFLFCRRDAFYAIGGFDEKYLAAEEVHLCRALRRKGRVVRLASTVHTSSRKYREHPWWKVLWVVTHIRQTDEQGRRWVQDRRNLGFWYDSRKP